MKKSDKTSWHCTKCGHIAPKWSGQCAGCGAWNTLEEKQAESQILKRIIVKGAIRQTISAIAAQKLEKERISSGFFEFDRVLGGGFLSDSLTLLFGKPGIGKSTISLQVALNIAQSGKKVLIASGEESVSQIAARAHRITKNYENLEILNEFSIENLLATAESINPDFIILDSVQTLISEELPSTSGSIPQIRTVTEKIMHFVKTRNIPCILIGHVTKEGEMAGPQLLAHLVDAVLVIEGDNHHEFRLLRSTKNRFGSVFEVGVFEMTEKGLIEVKNPSAAFLSGRLENAVGSVIFPTIEGTRSFLVEIQALAAITKFGLPKRTANGVFLSRLNILIAVLQNHAKINFDNRDVFTNVVGGFKVSEPAADLPLALALISAHRKKPLPNNLCSIGEIGLSGEVRSVSHLEKRLHEAQKLGFTKAFIPNVQHLLKIKGLELVPIRTVMELVSKI